MKTYTVSVSIGLVGCTRTSEFEAPDDATEEELETLAFETVCEMIDWNYNEN
jgi:hypothetical protein